MVREGRIDYDRLKVLVHDAVRFLDDTIDAGRYPIEAIRAISRANRKIGLGVMGFAHMLIKLGIPYDSDEAVTAARDLMGFIDKNRKRHPGNWPQNAAYSPITGEASGRKRASA